MAEPKQVLAAPRWSVRSVAVRCRDGPDRLLTVYRLLLAATPNGSPVRGDASQTSEEVPHASSDLRSRLD